MRFIWDENKRKANILKHGLDFTDAETVFAGLTYTFDDDRAHYEEDQFIEEDRFITVGMVKGKIVVIAHTEQDGKIRVISMRKATKYEQKKFIEGFGH